MRTIRRWIYREVTLTVAFVVLGFLSLFSFFDLVSEVQSLGNHGAAPYQLQHALLYILLLMPNHVYELLPIGVLIGTIFVMARLAQSSEFTILRTSGLGPWRALITLLALGVLYVVATFLVGDYLAPLSDRNAQLLKARFQGQITSGQTGAWLRERQSYAQYVVNVRALDADGRMRGIQLFEFDNRGLLVSATEADSAQMTSGDAWLLQSVQRMEFPDVRNHDSPTQRHTLSALRWPNQLTAEMVSAALLQPERMRTVDLFRYIRHLEANGQSAQRYAIEFWKKVFYPISCLVMVVLALPFAYLHFRGGGIAGYVFGGVMAGISFFLLNNIFGYMGTLQNWQPWLTAALPGLFYSAISLTAFGWLVLRR